MSQLAKAVQKFSDSKRLFVPIAKHVVALAYNPANSLADHKYPATITIYLSSGKEIILVAKAEHNPDMCQSLFDSMCSYVENTNV